MLTEEAVVQQYKASMATSSHERDHQLSTRNAKMKNRSDAGENEHTFPPPPANALIQSQSANNDILSSLPPPPPFDLRVLHLSVGVPPPSHYLPLPIPIPIPALLQKRTPHDDTRSKAILTDVSAECHAGEMLAM